MHTCFFNNATHTGSDSERSALGTYLHATSRTPPFPPDVNVALISLSRLLPQHCTVPPVCLPLASKLAVPETQGALNPYVPNTTIKITTCPLNHTTQIQIP